MNTLLAYALLTFLGCVLWSAWRRRRDIAEANRRDRRQRMQVSRDAAICRMLAQLPASEESDD